MTSNLKKLDSLLFYVGDTRKTAAFYQKLGFEVLENESDRGVVKLGDFSLHFHDKGAEQKPEFIKEAQAKPKGTGLYIYIGVSAIDDFYRSLLASDITPSSEPRDWPWGNREFVLRDPDGYKLVFYEELKKEL